MTALMQQAELLSSLAQKVNADNTDQSMENAWKVNNAQPCCVILDSFCHLTSETDHSVAQSFSNNKLLLLLFLICPGSTGFLE